MTDLVKIKGLKGKQNKKKWAKNIDVSQLLQARRRQHDAEIRQKFRAELEVVDDNDNVRPPLDPNRFKNKVQPFAKPKYDNRIVRNLGLDKVDDPWSASFDGKHKYQKTQVPAVIVPESGHSYNPREVDIEHLKDRIIDYEQSIPNPRKVKPASELPVVEVRHRNKKKRAAQLEARERAQQKQLRQQIHNFKKIKNELQEKEEKIVQGIKTRQIKKEKLKRQILTGRVRKGTKLGKRIYRYKEYLPEGQRQEKVSKVQLNNELVRERFDSIYRRGVFEPRNIKVHANKHKHIKVKERAFIE